MAGGFFTTLRWALGAPRRLQSAVAALPPAHGARFGFVAAMVGIVGTAFKDLVVDLPVQAPRTEAFGREMQRFVVCALEQQERFSAAVEPWMAGRLPLAPVLALVLLYGLAGFFHLVATGIGARGVLFRDALRNVGYGLAPLALAALPLLSFAGCFMWSLVLCGIALRRTYDFSTLLTVVVASLPFWAWLGVEVLLAARIAAPCLGLV
jgi:hypothetical protein